MKKENEYSKDIVHSRPYSNKYRCRKECGLKEQRGGWSRDGVT